MSLVNSLPFCQVGSTALGSILCEGGQEGHVLLQYSGSIALGLVRIGVTTGSEYACNRTSLRRRTAD